MRSSFRLIGNLRSLIVFALVFGAGYMLFTESIHTRDSVYAEEIEEHFPAPDLVFERLEGGRVRISDYRGKWVFLNLWATWCPPCIKEMPSMEKFYQKFKDKNLTVLAVSLDKGDIGKVRKFVEKYKLTFEIVLDPEFTSMRAFNISGIPATFLINPDGDVVAQALGPRDWTDPVIIDYFADLMSIDKKEFL